MTENPRTMKKFIAYLVSMVLLTGLLVVAGASNPIVAFPDAGLEAAVRTKLDRPQGLIYHNDLQSITRLNAAGYDIQDLTGLERMHRLVDLDLSYNAVASVAPLGSLSFLRTLDLTQNGMGDLAAHQFNVFRGHALRELTLSGNPGLSGLSTLAGFPLLEALTIRESGLSDLAGLPDLVFLTALDLRGNALENLGTLPALPVLTSLNLRENDLEDISNLNRLDGLTYLNLHSNGRIQSVASLEALTGLSTLILEGVPLKGQERTLLGLTGLERLNVTNTGFADYGVLEALRGAGALTGEVQPAVLRYDLAPPVFSEEGGFHGAPFLLEIAPPKADAILRYTLDGSMPTASSPLYEGPIRIEEGLGEAPLSRIPTAERWAAPRGTVAQGTVVRVRAFSPEGGESAVVTRSFFVSPQGAERHSLPVVSLVTEASHFFDPVTGIYNEANARTRGAEWERPVHVEFFETDGTLAFAQEAGVRIQGDTSAALSQKSLRLYARGTYDEASYFQHAVFPGLTDAQGLPKTDFKRLVLRNSGNDWNSTMIRDALMHRLAGSLDSMDTQAYRPAVVYLNGEYWGIHNLRERFEQHYLATTYGVAVEDVALLEGGGKVEVGTPEDGAAYQALLAYVERHGVTAPEHFDYVRARMDVDNFLDYIVVETYFGNYDWPNNNIRWWRVTRPERYPEGPEETDGRWRWMLYDTDLGFARYATYEDRHGGLGDVTHNTIHWVLTELDGRRGNRIWPNLLIRAFLANPEYRDRFLLRHADLLNSRFLPEAVAEDVAVLSQGIAPEMAEHLARWNLFAGSVARWESNVQQLNAFARERPDILRGHLLEAFDLPGLTEVSVLPAEGGTVRVNTLLLSEELPGWKEGAPWTGSYFQGVALPLEAVPDPGHAFVGWEGLEGDAARMAPVLDGPLTLRPLFQPLP